MANQSLRVPAAATKILSGGSGQKAQSKSVSMAGGGGATQEGNGGAVELFGGATVKGRDRSFKRVSAKFSKNNFASEVAMRKSLVYKGSQFTTNRAFNDTYQTGQMQRKLK